MENQEKVILYNINLLDNQVFQRAVHILYKRFCTTEHMG